jgi:hypothetical protein
MIAGVAATFIPGLRLAGEYYAEVVRPLLDERFPALEYALGLTEPLGTGTRPFYDRPYQVIGAERFATALLGAISDPEIRRLPPIGAADQFIDNTDALVAVRHARAVIGGS